jgi:hypothetical protein
MDAYSRSVTQIELYTADDKPCGFGTGFFYAHNEALYLVTNWHVITGVDPVTMLPVGSGAPAPDYAVYYTKHTANEKGELSPPPQHAITNVKIKLDLYNAGSPTWFEHTTRQNVDVAAFRLDEWIKLPSFVSIPVNNVEQSPGLQPAAGMDCFVLGYPEGMVGPGLTPIWKRASIASEPAYNWRDQPRFLIDTATRSGMSGAPVVLRHSGILKQSEGPGMGPSDLIGTMTRFAGIYSGRIGDDLLEVQLGVVWRADVLDDILSQNTSGMNPYR